MVREINGPGLLRELLDLIPALPSKEPPVLFLTNDHMVQTIAEGWPSLEGRYRLSWSDRRLEILSLLEKSEHLARSQATDCRYPLSALVPELPGAGALPPDLRYPVIAKPTRPLSSFKVRVLEDPAELQRLAFEHPDALPFVVQNYVAGPEERTHFCAMYLDHGRELARFVGRKLRSKPMGHTTIAEPVRNERLHSITRRFFDGLDLSGPVSLECKFDDDGEAWIIEPTVGRTDFWIGACIANGVNLPWLEYCHQAGLPIPVFSQRYGRTWFNTERDPAGIAWWASQVLRGRFTARLPALPYFSLRDPYPVPSATRRIGQKLQRRISARSTPK
jgi:predicted ATP-grasp superfamily ATP-dependent carboligase